MPSFQSTQTRVTLGNRFLWQNLLDDSIVRQAFDDSIHVCFDRWLRICPASKPCVHQFFQERHRRRNRVLISGTFSRRSHTLCHSPCLCPVSCAFSLVVLSHHPTTRRNSQTESLASDPFIDPQHVFPQVCGDVAHPLLWIEHRHCTTVAKVRVSVRTLHVLWLTVSPELPFLGEPALAPSSTHPATKSSA